MAVTSMRRSSIFNFIKSNKISAKPPSIGAQVLSTTGSPVVGTYTDTSLNKKYDRYVFNGSGSITFKRPGYARVLVVGGGGGAAGFATNQTGAGGAGGVRWGSFRVNASAYTVTVGGGGGGVTGGDAGSGGNSGLVGILLSSGGRGGKHRDGFVSNAYPGFGGNAGSNGYANGFGLALGGGAGGLAYGSAVTGITFDWSGSSIQYGLGQDASLGSTRNGTANTGECGRYRGAGGSGRVIVMVEV
jgi:hypothetical protein